MLSIQQIRNEICERICQKKNLPIFFTMIYINDPCTNEKMFTVISRNFFYIGERDDTKIPQKIHEITLFPSTKKDLYKLYLDELAKGNGVNSPVKVKMDGKTFIFYVPGTYYIDNGLYLSRDEEQFIGVSYKEMPNKGERHFMNKIKPDGGMKYKYTIKK
jgi:hypothetical protein